METTILITGANGQLGQELKELSLLYPGYRFIYTSRGDLPVGDASALETFFETHQISYCINCAAYTAVDKAEADIDGAYSINAAAPGKLASLCRQYEVALIHISTDYVYAGTDSARPLKETDPTGPLNVYGASKLKGEQLALQQNPDTIIIRTSWLYSSYGTNFVKTMLRLFSQKDEVKVVADQVGCPTYAADLAAVIFQFITKMESGADLSGIYNYSNSGVSTWYDFAMTIKLLTNSDCLVKPTSSENYITPAKRPAYSVLDTNKIREALGIVIPAWEDSLKKCLSKILPHL